MKFSTSSSQLQKILGNVAGVIPAKSTLPILENFLFEVSGDTLNISATDLDTSMSVSMKVSDAQDGKITVPAKRLSETMRTLPPIDLVFTADLTSNKIAIRTANGEYKLTGESSESYPSIPAFRAKEEMNIDNETLRRLIGKTTFAVSSDELRPAMMGILFQIKKGEIRAVATDGHRLVRMINTSASAASQNMERDIIVPAKALNLVLKSMNGSDNSIAFSESHAMFSSGGTTLVSRMIEEKYPSYETVIPLDNDKTMIIKKKDLLESVRRTALYASSTTHQVRFSLKKGNLTVSAEDIDFGSEAKETIKCDYSSDPMDIGFNSSYIIDTLSQVDTDEAMILFSSPTRASIIKPATQREGENLLMLVMPVRLNA
jgi:DNA polymerase-3 subunit beta